MTDRKPCKCPSIERCTGVPLPSGFYCRARQAEAEAYDDPMGEDFDDEPDEYEEALGNCSSFLDGGYYVCMAAGSEECDECPFNRDLGKTPKQVEEDYADTVDGEVK